MKTRAVFVAVAFAALTSLLTSVALADSLSVTLTGNWSYDSSSGLAKGDQTSTLTPGSSTYTGAFSVNTNLVNQCLEGPTVNLTYPNATSPTSTLVLKLNSPLCQGQDVTFTIISGTGVFKQASGGGTVSYSQAGTFTFADTSAGGGFFHSMGFAPGATPELDSLLLFGSGALGLAGYGLTRLRARRRGGSA